MSLKIGSHAGERYLQIFNTYIANIFLHYLHYFFAFYQSAMPDRQIHKFEHIHFGD